MHSYGGQQEQLINRLKRIEGQVKGLQRMIEEDHYCISILTQVSAARAALNKVAMLVMENHVRGCVVNAVQETGGDETIKELMDAIERYSKG